MGDGDWELGMRSEELRMMVENLTLRWTYGADFFDSKGNDLFRHLLRKCHLLLKEKAFVAPAAIPVPCSLFP